MNRTHPAAARSDAPRGTAWRQAPNGWDLTDTETGDRLASVQPHNPRHDEPSGQWWVRLYPTDRDIAGAELCRSESEAVSRANLHTSGAAQKRQRARR